jgi:outer membrane biogenesis lipoprotein LolB
MRSLPIRSLVPIVVALLFSACASMQRSTDTPQIPSDAVESTRTESNGDVVSEYRVQGQLRIVRVQPAHGVTYYMIDSNGDGHLDRSQGEVAPVYYKLYSW